MSRFSLSISRSIALRETAESTLTCVCSSSASMAPTPTKHGRDQAMDFGGFLNDLQDWELLLKDKDKKKKTQVSGKATSSSSNEGRRSTAGQSNYAASYDVASRLSSSFSAEESMPDAFSEKELGNDFFKKKNFNEAIDCYSRSIAFSPTAVAYANRAMAYLKVKRFQEAEDDCTEALNLDDRYIKAYSRRATARKEIGKFKESLEDAEFALRLEPDNQEIKKQYAESRSLFEKEVLKKPSGVLKGYVSGKKTVNSENGGRSLGAAAIQDTNKERSQPESLQSVAPVQEIKRAVSVESKTQPKSSTSKDTDKQRPIEIHKRTDKTGKPELKASVQELATRASALALLEAEKNITPPKSAYQFEVSWRGFNGNRSLQTRLLKVTSPSSIPQIFKNALSPPLLIDIIKCLATLFTEDMELSVGYLYNLTKVPRFDILIMCLSSSNKDELVKIWSEVFSSEATPVEYVETLDALRPKYGLKRDSEMFSKRLD